ncbi:hypothetical protein [Thalassotalea eurytherma]|uniref:STAS/SEC14 domain-containing protein n=1 Tax=Thalassotalea eurytherma TaxID=1144278 RepID=A0ABQ6H6F9_9GAMM|nr:hypothetical protein [Thalassotalea eurytherma]GLX83738.1 hypothetical protein theurythT_31910 [Thalassotalea eurytherma]
MNAHGDITLFWDGDLLIVKTFGPFNELGLKIIISKIRESILNKGLESWRKMEIWDEETLGSPDVVATGEAVAKWYKDNGCIASAIIVCNSLQEQLVDKITSNNTKSFRDQETAMNWLSLQNT